MKRSILFLSILFILAATSLHAQDSRKQVQSKVIETIDGREYYIHTIKKGQTLYMICKLYGADINEVIKENPEVKEGIKADQKIRIPVNKPAETVKKSPKPIVTETKPALPVEEETPCANTQFPNGKTYRVALMLPLYLDQVSQMDVENIPAIEPVRYKSLQYIEFYEGFRMALDSLEKNGLSLKVYVYDIDKDTNKTKRLLRNPDLRNMDLIIGLIYQKNFQMVAEFAQKNGINIINPISERNQIIRDHSHVFKMIPSDESQYSHLAELLSRKFNGDNILIVRNGKFPVKDAAEHMNNECSKINVQARVTEGVGAAISNLSNEKKNVFIVFSENKVYALELLTKLNEIRNDFTITVIGLPRWDKIEGLESDYLVNLKVHVLAPWFIDYSEPEVNRFVFSFHDKYKTDPGILAFQGFDTGFYFLTALSKYGKNFGHCLSDLHMKSLHTDFQFMQTNNNGYENQHWEMYEYDNYRLKRISW
ncbi:MAG: LysM peptidoglycan-binding domain-containing protein [Bacteroidetes bacterium]|nr:LysM peptidoglycan-binding domain-containing protein [Bacteroidota bacterium]